MKSIINELNKEYVFKEQIFSNNNKGYSAITNQKDILKMNGQI